MNVPIRRVFGLFAALFALLVVFTSRWAVIEAESLEDNTANRRPLLEEQRVPRGLILAADGTRIAVNDRRGSGETVRYVRRYPLGPLFGHPVGYSFVRHGRAGLERSLNDPLAGRTDELGSIFEELSGRGQEGDDVRTSLDADAQREALAALGGQKGSVVAIEPKTGQVQVMASAPSFDPAEVPERFRELNRDRDAPLLNRATQSRYPPGSTFKVVTAAAALDTNRFNPGSVLPGPSPKTISGVPLENFGGADFGPITLTEALTKSVNTVFAQVGAALGRETLVRYMKRFGFYEDPPVDYPSGAITPSGVVSGGRLVDAGTGFDVGRVAIGQGGAEGQVLTTPLQMAMVAAAVANRGELMRPRLVDRVVAPDGRVKDRVSAREQSQVMGAAAADRLTAMMTAVVESGSGTAAALPSVKVAGKTGTAEVEGGRANQAWFIAFAPVGDPRTAIAVTVERANGTGGEVAAPIARRVLGALLGVEGKAPSRPPAAGGF
ncbi:MAG: penicillin-binding transpeptidase domain-containing protein [Actinomycetota bacterium]|nr:penicillin-binding transpeptidase domain-containing protein [Actinomycetota bacterium]